MSALKHTPEMRVVDPQDVGAELLGKFTEDGREIIAVACSHKGLAIEVKEVNGAREVQVIF